MSRVELGRQKGARLLVQHTHWRPVTSQNGVGGARSAADHSEKALDLGTVVCVNGITILNAKRVQWELDSGKMTSIMVFKGGGVIE